MVKYLVRGSDLVFRFDGRTFTRIEDIVPFLPRGVDPEWRESMTVGLREAWSLFKEDELGVESDSARKTAKSGYKVHTERKWLGPDLKPMACKVEVISRFKQGPESEDYELLVLEPQDTKEMEERLKPSGLVLRSPIICKVEPQPWQIPTSDSRIYEGVPSLDFEVMGHLFRFSVVTSGAGRGVFMSVFPTAKGKRSSKKFKSQGAPIDLGIYAPLSSDHWKSTSMFDLKNFWTRGEGAAYAMVDSTRPGKVLDVTDDITGDLGTVARNCVWTYMNKKKGGHTGQVLHAGIDLSGAVHVLLHNDCRPEYGVSYEVFYEYGDRLKKHHTSTDEKRLATEEEVFNDDVSILAKVSNWDLESVGECIGFVERVYQDVDRSEPPIGFLERFFCVVLALHKRVASTDSSSSASNGSGEASARRLLKAILMSYNGGCASLLGNTYSCEMIKRVYGDKTDAELREHLEQLEQA